MARGEMKQRRSDELHSDHFPCNTPGCSEPCECVCETQEREREGVQVRTSRCVAHVCVFPCVYAQQK